MKNFIRLILFIAVSVNGAYSQTAFPKYDMRDHLTPGRLTIAMWDFSWMNCHYKGGPFEDFDKVLAEVKERGFNTVRIDCFPHITGALKNIDDEVTVKGDPLANWGQTDKDRKHKPVRELIEFMQAAKRAGIYVILSTWNGEVKEFPEMKKRLREDRNLFRSNWTNTLNLLAEHQLLDIVLYVDLDQEFPYFSPYENEINELAAAPPAGAPADPMELAGRADQSLVSLAWNRRQLNYVKQLFEEMIPYFQSTFPGLRFTYSLTSFTKEVRALGLQLFDVLELHMWIHSPRFDNRSGFGSLQKDRGDHDYSGYQQRIDDAMESMRPMLMHEMYKKIEFAMSWGEEISAPVVTTESWGPWWHMDHKDLRWEWLSEWCMECMEVSAKAGFWGATPWNFSHPYWKNWSDIEWYQKINGIFR